MNGTPSTVLVVDDSTTTRKLVRAVLSAEGYQVQEAPDGWTALDLAIEQRPDLVLMDLLLPDFDGFDLLRQLRALPGCATLPVLAYSGWLSKMDEARRQGIEFTDYLVKPVELSRLRQVVRAHLSERRPALRDDLAGRRVLIVDDDPLQLRLLATTLSEAGFVLSSADDSSRALDVAREVHPDAVVADVLMPRVDGFQLCRSFRRDPELGSLPVVLTIATTIDLAELGFARNVGASALVHRSTDPREVITAVRAALSEPPPTPQGELPPDYAERLLRQLERQALLSGELTQRIALLESQLVALHRRVRGLTGELTGPPASPSSED